nr:MAG TPA: hypothetical protein [Caudoviricetes sp.]
MRCYFYVVIYLFSVFTRLKSRFLGIYVLSTRIFQYDV